MISLFRISRVSKAGLKIWTMTRVIQQLPEGQDMVADITEPSKLDVTVDIVHLRQQRWK
jgi:hypothetical protein